MNSDRVRIGLGLACVVGSSAAVLVLQRQTSELRERIASLEATAKSGANESAEPRIVERVVVRDAPHPAPSAAPVPTAQENAMAEPSPRALGPKIVRTKDEVSQLVASRFQADPVDRSAAATDARDEISNAIAERGAEGVRLQSLECRQRLCRAELEFRDSDADRAVMNSLFRGERQLHMGGAIVPDRLASNDGRVLATLYVARSGEIDLE